jgi:hypothetical protein
VSFTNETKSAAHTPVDVPYSFEIQQGASNTNRLVDLDGMNLLSDMEVDIPAIPDPNIGLEMSLELVVESPQEDVEDLPWGDDPSTASWAPLMAEVR